MAYLLFTGASGYIGSHTAYCFLKNTDYHLVIIDDSKRISTTYNRASHRELPLLKAILMTQSKCALCLKLTHLKP